MTDDVGALLALALEDAAKREREAFANFHRVISETNSSGITHLNSERMLEAHREVELSLENHVQASKRYVRFLVNGIVPDDLKVTGRRP